MRRGALLAVVALLTAAVTPAVAAAPGTQAAEEPPVTGLALFTTTDPSPPPLSVGFSVRNDREFAFAAYVDGELVGATAFTSLSGGSTVDGYEVPVTAGLGGEQTVTVYAVRDSNGNGEVDPSDEPYTQDGAPVSTTGTFDFGAPGHVDSLSFYTGYDDDPRPVRVGFSVRPNTTVAFALYADGDLVGHTGYDHYGSRLYADGMEVPLEANLAGEVELTVVALHDANGNGVVDDADEPHRRDGERVASSMTFDFGDESTTTGTPTTTPSNPTDGTTGPGDDGAGSSATVPGFGVAGALAALAAASALARRK